jgi:hypothetical protein
MRSLGTSFVTFTGKAPGKSAKLHVTVAPSRSGALAPPVVKYEDSSLGSVTAPKTSATGRAIFP